ncbi:CDP-glucose 4,6-dehydratase [Paenibacillus sp. MY03]|uniref:CDP-glucose 4,6-dehydratase n=1 Tax=Paenibacillus sp. MY03 TaxID=302980 RepID=UPI000B3C1D07|nr:CDP-glucose 4,6-dehydratase [Paenibacillus sp. MY03]OUS75139.1 CDP-glucose 4,6-dehydratase [Paenibacillus sp. MY03]
MGLLDRYRGMKVLVTGHTGFKGSWMSKVLTLSGAEVIGYALAPPTEPSLFKLSEVDNKLSSITGDIRDLKRLQDCFATYQPEIVIHMAAQPLVRESYKNPVDTYAVNVMGTVNLLEAVRGCDSVKSVVNVTTDKVYRNKEWGWGYRENDELNGFDPYSNSKSCSELVTSSYINSFFSFRQQSCAISTCRAGNVIGGGDFAIDRIIPDCVRAVSANREIIVRNPASTRPYQHVLEPIFAYLQLAISQLENSKFAGSYNIGPDDEDCVSTGELVDMFCGIWGESASWNCIPEENAPHEAHYLKLDCSMFKSAIGWKPKWHIEDALKKTVEWSKAYQNGENISEVMNRQILAYAEG